MKMLNQGGAGNSAYRRHRGSVAATPAMAAVSGPYTTGFAGVTIDKTAEAHDEHLADDRWLRRRRSPMLTATRRCGSATRSRPAASGDQLFSPTLDGAGHRDRAGAKRSPRPSCSSRSRASAGPAGADGCPQQPGQGGRAATSRTRDHRRHQPGHCGVVPRRQRRGRLHVHDGGHRARRQQAAHREAHAHQEARHEEVDQQRRLLGAGGRQAGQEHYVEAYYEKTGEGEYNTDTLMFRLSGAVAAVPVGLLIDDVTMATSYLALTPPSRGGPTASVGPPTCAEVPAQISATVAGVLGQVSPVTNTTAGPRIARRVRVTVAGSGRRARHRPPPRMHNRPNGR